MIKNRNLHEAATTMLVFVVTLSSYAAEPSAPPTKTAEPRHSDFGQLINRIETTMREHLFSSDAFDDVRTQRFILLLRHAGERCQTDADFLRRAWSAAANLPFSHFDLTKVATRVADGPTPSAAPRPPDLEVTNGPDGISVLNIRSFNVLTIDDIRAAFGRIEAAGAKALVIDLRENRGGTFVSTVVACHLLDRPTMVGAVIGKKMRSQALTGDFTGIPIFSPARLSLETFFELMEREGGLVGRTEPLTPHFAGPVAVTTSRETASACEPLVEVLQRTRRATIIGEKTAGAILSASPFDVGQGWELRIPVYDVLTAEGVRLEGRGVDPDIRVPRTEAMAVARRHLLSHAGDSRNP